MIGRTLPVLAAVALLATPLAAMEVPYLGGRVNDLASMMSEGDEVRVEQTLAQLERDTGAQMVVLTVPSLEGEVLEDYALRVAETWKLGRADQDDGILILVARDERRIRIEVGYGLEGTVPDALAKRIIDGIMTPRFREGDFAAGIEEAVGALSSLIRGEAVELPDGATELTGFEAVIASVIAGSIFFIVVGTFSVVALFTKGGQAWFIYLFLMPFYMLFPIGIFGPWGLIFAPLWIVGFPILRRLTWRTDWGRSFRSAHPGWVSFASSSGRSSGGGGFSGGGGSFGGGGASGGW